MAHSYSGPEISLLLSDIFGMVQKRLLTVILISVLKCILYLLCRYLARLSSSVQALAQDHRNDVLTNIVAIICGYFGKLN